MKSELFKILLYPARKLFLIVCELNYCGIGTQLRNKLLTNPKPIEEQWEKVGGDINDLIKIFY